MFNVGFLGVSCIACRSVCVCVSMQVCLYVCLCVSVQVLCGLNAPAPNVVTHPLTHPNEPSSAMREAQKEKMAKLQKNLKVSVEFSATLTVLQNMQDLRSSSSPSGQSMKPSHSTWSSMQRYRPCRSGVGHAKRSMPSIAVGHSARVKGQTVSRNSFTIM